MDDFTPEQLQRWNAWQHGNAISMRRSDRMARFVGVSMLVTSALVAIAAVLSR